MSPLGSEWVPDEDGFPHRNAARVVVFNAQGQILLVHGHDREDPRHHWWFTIGGGLEPGEDPRDGAVRELYEETGIKVSADDLIGPVLYRRAQFEFLAVTARQDEHYFVVHTDAAELSDQGWTDLERDVLDEQRWWDLEDLEELSQTTMLTPAGLPELAPRWRDGWDGVMREMWEGRSPEGQ
ncbi:NUDIX hydrolase [Schaalia sp. Marseille-Q2122]|uniref:NUDIX hydrolase n=1 Tax=Schaalia sp. Marseille-Q2122 TaxID=2736604 RepID=UPI00158E583A|nr:NUDIX domain-containing protein [Schaalia sp. Marseille-Q2122]